MFNYTGYALVRNIIRLYNMWLCACVITIFLGRCHSDEIRNLTNSLFSADAPTKCAPEMTIFPLYAQIGDAFTISCGITDDCTDVVYFAFNVNTNTVAWGCMPYGYFINPEDVLYCNCSSTDVTQYDCSPLIEPVQGLQVNLCMIAQMEYFGTWICKTAESTGDIQHLKHHDPASTPILNLPSTQLVLGERTQIECETVQGDPEADIWWYIEYGDGIIRNDTANSTSTRANNTVISILDYLPEKQHNTGNIHCEAVQYIGFITTVPSTKYPLNITYGPEVEIGPCPEGHVAEEATHTTLVCNVSDANPYVSAFEWWYNENYIEGETGGTFMIKEVSLTDAGTYSCSGVNGVEPGKSNDSLIIVVQYGPIVSKPKDRETITLIEGSTTELECVVSAFPNGTVGWIRDDTFINGNTLKLQNVKRDDAGYYTCNAFNEITSCGHLPQRREQNVTIYLDIIYGGFTSGQIIGLTLLCVLFLASIVLNAAFIYKYCVGDRANEPPYEDVQSLEPESMEPEPNGYASIRLSSHYGQIPDARPVSTRMNPVDETRYETATKYETVVHGSCCSFDESNQYIPVINNPAYICGENTTDVI